MPVLGPADHCSRTHACAPVSNQNFCNSLVQSRVHNLQKPNAAYGHTIYQKLYWWNNEFLLVFLQPQDPLCEHLLYNEFTHEHLHCKWSIADFKSLHLNNNTAISALTPLTDCQARWFRTVLQLRDLARCTYWVEHELFCTWQLKFGWNRIIR